MRRIPPSHFERNIANQAILVKDKRLPNVTRLSDDPRERPQPTGHIDALDGWRAFSIVAVLCAHLVPLPRFTQFNAMFGAAGMAVFFTLSGFLITDMLWRDQNTFRFLTRRFMRIVPLAWLAIAVLVIASRPPIGVALANFLFFANLPPIRLLEGGAHLWSLCVEAQFYLCVAIAVAIGGRKALIVLPAVMILVTLWRIIDGETVSIVTWHRIDEILAGATIALAQHRLRLHLSARAAGLIVWLAFALLLIGSHPAAGALQYFRPYFAAALIGASLVSLPAGLAPILRSRPAAYIAQISYALYVVHGMLTATPLGGEGLSKAARLVLVPINFALSFALAHLSTFAFEARWIAWGKRLTARRVEEVSR